MLERPPTYPERRRRAPVPLRGAARRAFEAAVEIVAPSPAKAGVRFDIAAQGVAFLEGYLAYLPWPLRKAFPWGLLAIEWGAVLFGGGRRFSRLDREARVRYVHRIEEWRILAPLGEVWTAVRGLAAASFYTHGEVAERLGYAHQAWIDAKVKERRERFGAPEPW